MRCNSFKKRSIPREDEDYDEITEMHAKKTPMRIMMTILRMMISMSQIRSIPC